MAVTSACDQEFLLEHKEMIRTFLDQGNVLVFSGRLFRPWLPGAGMFQPKTIHTYHDYTVHLVKEHPVFEGVREEDLMLRKGVAGFYARGHHEPPPGAEILTRLVDAEHGEPIVYVDRASTRGVIRSFSPPDGTETLLRLEDGGAIMYLDRVSSNGTLLMTTLDPTYHYGSYFMPATERFLDSFLPWVRAELLKG
ncbi:MAG TPA: hypothetical protein VFH48_07590 [Chloroflexota bacterium]|nr:hypothetical protein [Chloroflexota bacterium]